MVVGADSLHAVLDELAAQDVVGISLRDELLELERARARLDAEVARRLLAFDQSHEWSVDGSKSAAAYLVKHTRCARGEANHRMRVAREMGELDETAAAWVTGDVTTKHVEAIARARHAAKADEQFAEFEAALLGVARTNTPERVTETARQWRDALDADLDRDGADTLAEDQHQRRSFDFSRSIHGMGFGNLTLDPLGSEFLETALHRAYEELHVANDPRTPAQQRADALVEIARVYLDAKASSRTNLPNVLLLADEATIAGDAVGESRLASGARIAPETARRLLCDANVQSLHMEDGVPLAMGRAVRTFTPHQFRALVARDAHCRGPCDCTVGPDHCEGHHLDEWERDDGPTDIDNGALFCRTNCHRMLHEGGWTVEGDPNGELRFYDRSGAYIGSSFPHEPAKPIKTKRRRNRRTDRLTRERLRALKEERAHVVGEQRGLFHRGEVAAAGHVGPTREVVAPFDPRAGVAHDLFREAGDAGGNRDELGGRLG